MKQVRFLIGIDSPKTSHSHYRHSKCVVS